MVSKLDLYILNSDNSVAPFPSEAEQIVLYDFAFEAQRMGSAPEITATIQANGSLENYITTKVFCEYNSERYYLKNLPESSKDNTDPRYTIDLTFVSERTILDNVYMIDAVQVDGNIDRYQSNSTIIVFTGTIEEFVGRLNASMAYTGVGYSVVLDEGIATESNLVSFQDKVFTEALQEGVKIFNVPYYYVGKVIHFGWAQNTIPTLKYGDGLLSINKSLRTERIINRATATGSSENIPYYYPNPTPNGYIIPVINDRSGAGIRVVNEAKLGKLAANSKLRYCEFETPLQVQGIYSSVSSLAANVDVAGTPILSTDGYVLIQKQSLTFVYIKVSWSSVTGGVDDFMIQYKAYIGDNKTKVRNIGVYAYTLEKRNSNIGKVDVAVLDASISAQIVGDYIVINSLPANQERYIGIVYSNDTNSYYGSVFYASPATALNDGWYIYNGDTRVEDRPVNIAQYGVLVKGTPTEGDEVSYSVTKKIPFATTLMPPIYRNSGGEHRFYDAINGVYEGVTFENEYSEENRKEAITKFENVKPTIVGVTNANGERIDMFAEFAYDLSDSDETEQTDKNSESFIHPYFYAKLRKFDGDNGFNLFAQAIESGEMTIEMTSGHCGACKFVIAVDENTQRNLVMVDANGNLIYDDATGKVKMASDAMGLDRQNDTQNYEVWIALKKDINTYGQVMPIANSTIKPSTDDTFVITNILLPQAYITAAEKKLEDDIIAFLVNNNTFQFEYSINFSRIFLKKRNDVFFTLSENALIPIEYNGKLLSFYVASYSYRKQKGELLPEISVSLTDNFESTPSGVEQVINAVQESIVKRGEPSGSTLGYTDERYVRKDAPDTVNERIAFDKGLDFKGSLTSKDFRRGHFAGVGFGVYTDDNGDAIIEADKLVIRKDLEVNNLVINQVSYMGGMQITSAASLEINRVIENDNTYQCFFDQKGGSVGNLFQVNDIAYSQRFDEENNTTKYYKRVVIAVDIDSITLSKSQADGEGVPMANDVVIQYGNTTDTNRQYIIIRDVIGGGYERMLSDLNSVSATGVEYYFAGRMDGDTPRWFVGNKSQQFIEYKDGRLQIKADVTIGANSDLSASEEFQEVKQTANQAKQVAQNAEASAKSYADELVKDLQNQLDGKVESFFYDYKPTLSNLPASEWTTDELKKEHLNDTFTNTESGQSWRWLFKDGSYQWVEIADTQSAEALAKAQEALGVANGKVAVFVTEPRTPYNAKDLWLQGEDGRIKRCTFTRTTTGEFYAEDWVNADDSHEYTDSEIAKYKKSVDVTIESLDAAIEAAEKASKDYTDEGKEALQASIDALNKAKANVTDVYDKATADGLINQAEADAIVAAQELADAARQLAIEVANSYADGVVDAEEKARIDQAEKNLAEAKKHAEDKAQDAEYNAKEYADEKFNIVRYLKDAFPQGSILNVNGVTLSALIGVKDNEENVVAGLYGGSSDKLNAEGYADKDYGAMLLFGGIEGVDKPTTYKTAIFENGYIISKRFQTSKEGKRVEIFGNELKVYGDDANNSVLSISYDSTGKPRLQYNDKSGNVSWYLSDKGISTSYTVEQIDEFLKRYIRNDISEDINVIHKFVNGIKIGDILLTYDSANEALCINGNMYALGGVTAGDVGNGGSGGGGGISYNRLDSWSDYSADKSGWVLSALLGNDLNTRLISVENAGYITQSALAPYALRSEIPSLVGYATQSWVGENYLSKSGGTINGSITLSIGNLVVSSGDTVVGKIYPRTDNEYTLGQDARKWKNILCYNINGSTPVNASNLKSTLGISDWALASAKPTYTASEVGALSVNGGDIGGSLNFRNGSSITCANGIVLEMYAGVDTYLRGSSNIYISAPNVYTQRNVYTYKVLDSGNYANYALSINGGTLSGSNRDLLSLDTSNTSGPRITLYENGNLIALIGCVPKQTTTDYGAYFVNVSSKFGVILGNDKKAYITLNTDTMSKDYQILHSGNYSSYALPITGGTVNGSITATSFTGVINSVAPTALFRAMSYTAGQYSRSASEEDGKIFIGSSVNNKVISSPHYDGTNTAQNIQSLRLAYNSSFFTEIATTPNSNHLWKRNVEAGGANPWERFVTEKAGVTWNISITGNADSANFVAKTYANENINFAKDESKIRLVSGVASNSTDLGFPKRYTAGLSVVSSYCGWQMVCYGSNIDYNPYYRSVTDKGVWGSWRQIAFLTDNVASATKLATPRTIWGQSFDGTQDITGALTAHAITTSSLTIGGATLTYDSVNEALCINGNMYALGGITAGGAGISAYTSLEARVARLEQQLNI